MTLPASQWVVIECYWHSVTVEHSSDQISLVLYYFQGSRWMCWSWPSMMRVLTSSLTRAPSTRLWCNLIRKLVQSMWLQSCSRSQSHCKFTSFIQNFEKNSGVFCYAHCSPSFAALSNFFVNALPYDLNLACLTWTSLSSLLTGYDTDYTSSTVLDCSLRVKIRYFHWI